MPKPSILRSPDRAGEGGFALATEGGGISPLSGMYAGSFQDAMNELCNSRNIRATAAKVIELEKIHGRDFEVGRFNRYLVPDTALPEAFHQNGGWTAFESDFLRMPEQLRMAVSKELRANFHAPDPLPVVYQTSTNVTPTHDAVVKRFAANGLEYIGVLYLCPNPKKPG